MPLRKGHTYSWAEILDQTGADGSPPYYLPHAGARVLAACLTLDLNPDAPNVILAGNGPEIARCADLFCAQGGSIPVCIKSGAREWLCCGHFKLSRPSSEPAEIRDHSARAKRADVYKILFLEEVPSP